MFRLGLFDENGEKEVYREVYTRSDAQKAYTHLHKTYNCTVWIEEIKSISSNELFEKIY